MCKVDHKSNDFTLEIVGFFAYRLTSFGFDHNKRLLEFLIFVNRAAKAAHRAGFQHGERLYDCFDSFSSVLRRARADTPPNSSDFLPVFHANYCKKSQISLKRFSHDDRIITMPFIEESAQNQCGQAASMGIPVGCVRITKIKAALHPIGFMQDCLRKCEESIFI